MPIFAVVTLKLKHGTSYRLGILQPPSAGPRSKRQYGVSYQGAQVTSWTMEQAVLWAPPGLLIEPMSTEMFGICHKISNSSEPVEYTANAQYDPTETAAPQVSADDSHSTGSNETASDHRDGLAGALEDSAVQIRVDADMLSCESA